MKAYKVFEQNWICRGYDFKDENGNIIGTIHTINAKPKLCKIGFHYCKRLVDCFNYYNFNLMNKVAEIEILGEMDNEGGDKECSNSIKIIKELSWSEVLELVNTGNCNTGIGNTGNRNTGNSNTGNCNSGNWNTGDSNTGNRNTGDWNTGNRNTGDWNTGNRNTGFFNRNTPEFINIFEKPCLLSKWNKTEKPNFIYFDLTKFIRTENMTEQEKIDNPDYEIIGGYLKKYEYKEAFIKSYLEAKAKPNWDKQYKLLINLPNFDKEIFKDISGIDIDKM